MRESNGHNDNENCYEGKNMNEDMADDVSTDNETTAAENKQPSSSPVHPLILIRVPLSPTSCLFSE